MGVITDPSVGKMAPTTKVTKTKDSPVKTPKGKRTERRPTAGSPTKPASALVTEANMQLLWACVKGFLADGQTVSVWHPEIGRPQHPTTA